LGKEVPVRRTGAYRHKKALDLCILSKNVGIDTLNPAVLRASVYWTFRTHDLPVFKPGPTLLRFRSRL